VYQSLLLLIAVMSIGAGSAHAALLQFNLHSYVPQGENSPNTWLYPSPVPQTIEASFVLDTLSGALTSGEYLGCLGTFRVTSAAFSNISVRADGQELWAAGGMTGGYGGDNAGANCPGGFFASLSFGDDDHSFSWSFDPSPGLDYGAFVASNDPTADLLLGFQGFSGNFSTAGDWGRLYGGTGFLCAPGETANCLTISVVPLPPAVWLLGTAVAGLGGRQWLRTKASASLA
jgi:hypothetical protein